MYYRGQSSSKNPIITVFYSHISYSSLFHFAYGKISIGTMVKSVLRVIIFPILPGITCSGPCHSLMQLNYACLPSMRCSMKVSRSIGDLYLKRPEFNKEPIFQQFGNPVPLRRPVLTAEPSIISKKIRPQDLFLIFASDGLWEHLTDDAAVEIVFKNPRTGIAKRLVGAALREAAKKREMRYKDITKIEKGIRRHFHDDISVVVIYLDYHKSKLSTTKKQRTVGCISAPIDIFSHNSDGEMENTYEKNFLCKDNQIRVVY